MKRLWLLFLVGCAGTKVAAQTDTIAQQIQVARADGAVRCAPVELAMAESHNEFAKEDLSLGRYHDAVREANVAGENAEKAIEKSPKELCNPEAKPPEQIPAAPKDSDGDGITDDKDDCPKKPEDKDGYQDDDGCPDDDNDGDGIADKIDDCPNDPEDRDGYQDEDGCPDPDNDKDGISDTIDQCPDQAEDVDGFQDDDGCPDPDNDADGIPDTQDKCPNDPGPGTPDGCPKKYDLVVVTQTKIELKQTVFFDTDKATIKKRSYALLDDVAKAMTDYPTIKVRIEGHTDSQGNDKHNLKLSQKRAESVRKYLIGKGIDGARMVPKGFGEEVPIADNRTKDGRAQNRRVEFFITDR